MNRLLTLSLLLTSFNALAADPSYFCFCENPGFVMKATVNSDGSLSTLSRIPDGTVSKGSFPPASGPILHGTVVSPTETRPASMAIAPDLYSIPVETTMVRDGRFKYSCTLVPSLED